MNARNPLSDDPQVTTTGSGNYGVRFVKFVTSGAPGGYSVREHVNLFETVRERDVYARRLQQERRGSRSTGPIIETFELDVATLAWFEPVYHRAAIIAPGASEQFGLVKVYATTPPKHEFFYPKTEEELRLLLAAQWEDSPRREPRSGEPRAPYDVYFLTPDKPLGLHMVIEP